jgi:hypothetical protein
MLFNVVALKSDSPRRSRLRIFPGARAPEIHLGRRRQVKNTATGLLVIGPLGQDAEKCLLTWKIRLWYMFHKVCSSRVWAGTTLAHKKATLARLMSVIVKGRGEIPLPMGGGACLNFHLVVQFTNLVARSAATLAAT